MPGDTTRRGYGYPHQREREQWAPKVRTGTINCRRCHTPIRPDQPWDLGHDDRDRTLPRHPEHRGRECPAGGNRATAGRRQRQEPAPAIAAFFNPQPRHDATDTGFF